MTVYDFPKQLVESIRSKECILFVGSGISQWSGLPSWRELIQKMVEFLSDRGLGAEERTEMEQMLSRGDLMMAASLCGSRMRKSDFRGFIDEAFIKPNPKPHELHRIIVDLGPNCFVTTNYDRLLQDAYQSVHDGLVLFSVNNDQPIEQARILKHGASHFIFAPHGCAEKCDSIVLKQEDYRNLRFNLKYTIETLRYLLLSRPVVYLGFGLRDPDFLMIKDEIASTYQGAERDHYAIMPDVSNLQKKFWREQYGVNIISYGTRKNKTNEASDRKKHSELLLLLQDLRRTVKESSTILGEPTLAFAIQSRSSLIRYCEALIYTSSVRHQREFRLTAIFRKDISPDTHSRVCPYISPFGRRMPVPELLDSFGNLILVGPPGAGKTHAVRAYATILAQKTLTKLRKIPELEDANIKHAIPLILLMKEYKGDIKRMIISRLPQSVDAKKALESGCLSLIFDAVNEVPRDLFDTKVLFNDISWLINSFPRNRFIFTSRTLNYVSAWALPIFELEPVSYGTLERYLKERCGISLNDIQEERARAMAEILRNPLFLTLFVRSNEDERHKFSSAISLLRHYLSTMEQKAIEKTGFRDLSLQKLLAPIAYHMLDHGVQTIRPHRILVDIQKSIHSEDTKPVNIFNTLISLGVLIPDAEGRIGFFHQSLLEYLAATELASLYSKDPMLLEEKIDFLGWDETILLFASLLPSDQKEGILKKIADNDIVFACKIFESATVKEKTIGLHLFDMISKRLSDEFLSIAAKKDLAQAISLIAPYGRKEVLMNLLNDPIMAKSASIFLARMEVKEAIPEITKLLLKDNVWPSDFARALRLLADESIVPRLIEFGKQVKEEELLTSNLAQILKDFESDALYSEILRLTRSDVIQDRIFAVEILGELDSKRSKEILAKMLLDPEYEVKWRAIFGLRGLLKRGPYRTAEIVVEMFRLLSDKKAGDSAAGYLRQLQDRTIAKKAASRLEGAVNAYERINICGVIAKDYPETAREVFFKALDNYKPAFHRPLYYALGSLGVEYIFPDIFSYLKTGNAKLRGTIINALRWALSPDEKLLISPEDCEFLITLWENSDNPFEKLDLGQLLTYHCAHMSKDMLLERFSDPAYPFREQLIDFVANLNLVKGDLSTNVIEWLITRLDCKSQFAYLQSPVARILGKVCDESTVIEKLIPLLRSENKTLRSNAYVAITHAERHIGKRFIKK